MIRFATKVRLYAFILGLFTAFSVPAFAQITIAVSDLSNLFGTGVSEQSYSNFDSSETMSVGNPSSSLSQSWALPPFFISDSSRIDNVLPSSTLYAADFPGATYAETFSRSDTGLTLQYFTYLKLSNDSLYSMGAAEHFFGSPGGHAIDSTIFQRGMRLVFRLPIALGNVVVGSPDTTVFGPGTFQVTTTTTTYDAYGTLTLPNGSFQALRSYSVTTFKVYAGGTLVNSSTSYSLEWTTREGHQLTVGVDSGATSGTVKLKSVSWTRVGQTPTFVSTSAKQPASFELEQNYPNPFNPTTVISYDLPVAGKISLKVYDVLGREVATLVDGEMEAGIHQVSFDASRLASGIYFYRIASGNYVAMKKMLLLK